MCNELELLTLEIKHTNCKPIIVMFWYRQEGTMHVISTLFENVLQRVETENKDIVLIGDVNCDILNPCCYTKKLQEVCENHHIYQLIKDPTRITETSFTLIRIIFILQMLIRLCQVE